VTVLGLEHVQLAMPPGAEDQARAFYAGLLGMSEVDKPASLAGRGGCWFASAAARVHLGVEAAFRPARKAHPALLVDDLAPLVDRLREAGHEIVSDLPLEGFERIHTADPFGNRIELMQKV